MATQSGLGTSTPKEAKEYFAQMERNQIEFEWLDKSDDEKACLWHFCGTLHDWRP
jgi:hypothetical protein